MDKLRHKKVLIILDDVINTQQIEDLVGENDLFGLGRKIIVTTRNKDVLKESDKFYKVTKINDEEAL